MARRTLACLLVGTLGIAAVAQSRSPAFVTVIDPAGAPVAGAEVTCVFTPDATNPWPADVVRAITDARGRARCDLLPRRLYTGWAVGAVDREGKRMLGDPLPLLAVGSVTELPLLDRAAPTTVRLAGHAAWREAGARGLRWFPHAREDASVDLPWPAGDDVALTTLPAVTGCLALVDERGELLVTAPVYAVAAPAIEFAPPARITARVVDDVGKPLAGVRIQALLYRFGSPWALLRTRPGNDTWWRQVGDTGADGTLEFPAPRPQSQRTSGVSTVHAGPLVLAASRTDYARQGLVLVSPVQAQFMLRPEAEVTFEAPAMAGVVGDVGAVEVADLKLPGGGLQWIRNFAPMHGKAPNWRVLQTAETVHVRVLLAGSVPVAIVDDAAATDGPPRRFDPTRLRRVEVQVADAAGNPCLSALGVGRRGDAQPIEWCAALPTNPAGHAVLQLPPGEWFVYATTIGAHDLACVTDTGTASLSLRLQPLPTVRVRVVDAGGRPIAGSRAFGFQTSFGALADASRQVWQSVAAETWWSHVARARADADGWIRIPDFDAYGVTAKVGLQSAQVRSKPLALPCEANAIVTIER